LVSLLFIIVGQIPVSVGSTAHSPESISFVDSKLKSPTFFTSKKTSPCILDGSTQESYASKIAPVTTRLSSYYLAVHPLFWQRFTEDFGGAVLAAQWRAAVKEVQKPFVMPD